MQSSDSPLVIFLLGATGDLAKKKILPALYALAQRQMFPKQYLIVGNGRRQMSSEEFATFARSAVQPTDDAQWVQFATNLRYVSGSVLEASTFKQLRSHVKADSSAANHIWYAATLPALYEPILHHLQQTSEIEENSTKFVLEKPFGIDLSSATQLATTLHKVFDESQVHLVDHYLAKETVQNILAFRFGNSLFEHVWKKEHIAAVQVQAPEDIGIRGREQFYDSVGTTRDFVQNHLLQMLATVLMSEPVANTQDAIRNQRQQLLESLHFDPSIPLDQQIIFGQFEGYTDHQGIDAHSRTETAVAARMLSSHPNWEGVPLYLRTGKLLEQRTAEISILFHCNPDSFFANQSQHADRNVLTFRIQPNEGVQLKLHAKKPGLELQLTDVQMSFCYADHFGSQELIEPYVKLISDVMNNKQHMFARTDGILSSWKAVEPILQHHADRSTKIHSYQPGSFGPAAFESLPKLDDLEWIHPDPTACLVQTVIQ